MRLLFTPKIAGISSSPPQWPWLQDKLWWMDGWMSSDREMADLERQIKKVDLEIKILKNKLELDAWPQVYCVN